MFERNHISIFWVLNENWKKCFARKASLPDMETLCKTRSACTNVCHHAFVPYGNPVLNATFVKKSIVFKRSKILPHHHHTFTPIQTSVAQLQESFSWNLSLYVQQPLKIGSTGHPLNPHVIPRQISGSYTRQHQKQYVHLPISRDVTIQNEQTCKVLWPLWLCCKINTGPKVIKLFHAQLIWAWNWSCS